MVRAQARTPEDMIVVPRGFDVYWQSHYYDPNVSGPQLPSLREGWYYVAVNDNHVAEGEEYGPYPTKQAAIYAIVFGD